MSIGLGPFLKIDNTEFKWYAILSASVIGSIDIKKKHIVIKKKR